MRQFLGIFAGSEGTTYVFDVLRRIRGILVLGLEPLEQHQAYMSGIPLEKRMEWLRCLWGLPLEVGQRSAWWQRLQEVIPGMPLENCPAEMDNIVACGVKIRLSTAGIEADAEASGRAGGLWLLRRRTPQERLVAELARVSVVLLIFERRNVVKRAVSSYRMLQERKSQFIRRNNSPSYIPPEVLMAEVKAYERYLAAAERMRRAALAAGVSVRTVVYEDFARDPVTGFESMLSDMGISGAANVRDLLASSRYQKFTPTDLSRVLENRDEILEALSGTPYESMLLDTIT